MPGTTSNGSNSASNCECRLRFLTPSEWEKILDDEEFISFLQAKWPILKGIGEGAQEVLAELNYLLYSEVIDETTKTILDPFTRLEIGPFLVSIGEQASDRNIKFIANLLARLLLEMNDLSTHPQRV